MVFSTNHDLVLGAMLGTYWEAICDFSDLLWPLGTSMVYLGTFPLFSGSSHPFCLWRGPKLSGDPKMVKNDHFWPKNGLKVAKKCEYGPKSSGNIPTENIEASGGRNAHFLQLLGHSCVKNGYFWHFWPLLGPQRGQDPSKSKIGWEDPENMGECAQIYHRSPTRSYEVGKDTYGLPGVPNLASSTRSWLVEKT